MKTLMNNLWAHIGYEDDGHLVHTDKKTGVQRISLKTWPNVASAKKAVTAGLGQIEWKSLKSHRRRRDLPPRSRLRGFSQSKS